MACVVGGAEYGGDLESQVVAGCGAAAAVRADVPSGCHRGHSGCLLPFGRPIRSGQGEQDVGYPQLRMFGLAECGTHVIFGAGLAALRTGEQILARAVLGSLRQGILLLADRGFYGVDLRREAAATGADLLWRVRKDLVLP